MRIILVRHPATTWNEKGLLQGSREGEVSRKGREEAKKFLSRVKSIKVDSIYYADNKRCSYLASKMKRLNPKAKLRKDERLNERSFGIFEGLSEHLVASKTKFDATDFLRKYKWVPEGGESLEGASHRIKNFLKDLTRQEKESKTTFIITSGGIMRVIVYVLGLKKLKEAMSWKAKNLETLEIHR